MSFFKRRWFSTTAFRPINMSHYESLKPSLGMPSPTTRNPVLNSPELVQLAEKAKGTWGEFTKEEAVKLYRATFSMTFKEMRAPKGHYKYVIPGVLGTTLASYALFIFVKENFGPKPPHTFNNPAWDAAAEEYMVSKNINPISGVSARHRKKKAEEAAKAAKAQAQ